MIRKPFKSNINDIGGTRLVSVPTLISAYQCGSIGTPFNDGYEYEEIPHIFIKNNKKPYIITAIGDSMAPDIQEGDKVVVEYRDHAEHNDIVAAFLNGIYLIKVFFRNNFSTYLKSININHPPIKIMEDDNFQILGKVTAVYRKVENIKLSKYLYE